MSTRPVVNTRPPAGGSSQQPKWFTPFRFTAIVCSMLFWVYVERGSLSSTSVNGTPPTKDHPGTGIQGDFGISNFQDGLLSSIFMLGMLIASPMFSEAVLRVNAMRLLGLGLGIWVVGVLGSGLAPNYWSLVCCRSLVGSGEAAVLVLAPPFIDDRAPPSKKGLWLAFLYTTIPVGTGVGYAFGGVVGANLHWRATFVIEAAVMLPFVVFMLLAPPLDLKKEARPIHANRTTISIILQFFEHLWIVLSNPVFMLTVAGYTVYTGVVGLVAYWGPKMALALFDLKSVDTFMGSAAGITGILGTMLGGLLMDRMGSSIPRLLTMSCMALMISALFMVPAVLFASKFIYFVAAFGMATIFMFFIQAPLNAVLLWTVPQDQRALGAATSLVSIHLFGDVPSPPAYGAFLDAMMAVTDSEAAAYRSTMPIVGTFLLIASLVLLVSALVSRRVPEYRTSPSRNSNHATRSDEEDVNNAETDTDTEGAPLLGHAN